MYLLVMDRLGVGISLAKSHRSPHFYEFAKRLFYKGKEVSPFPFSALKESDKSIYRLVNLLREQSKRGWVNQEISLTVDSYYGTVKGRPSRNRRTLVNRAILCNAVLDKLQGIISAKDCLIIILRLYDTPIEISEEFADNIFKLSINDLFTKSCIKFSPGQSTREPLGDFAINMVTFLSGL